MSLQQIQSLMVNLSINPRLSDQLFEEPQAVQTAYQLADDEMQAAQLLQERDLAVFQTHVAMKRLNRLALTYVSRSLSLFSNSNRAELLREFVTLHEMRQNVWMQYVPVLLDYLWEKVEESPHRDLVREVIAFEKWMFDCCKPPEDAETENGLAIAPGVYVASFKLPGELLISGKFQGQKLSELFGTEGYVLAQWNGKTVDLFEIDSGYYQFLTQCAGQSWQKEALVQLAEGVAVRYEDRTAVDMIDELFGAGILVACGKEVQSWQEA